jgi:hypothetical protein
MAYAPVTALVVTLSATGLLRYLRISRAIVGQPLVPCIPVARACLRRLAAIGGVMGLAWLGSVLFVTVAIWNGLSNRQPVAVAIEIILALGGLILMLFPLANVQHALYDFKRELLMAAASRYLPSDVPLRAIALEYVTELEECAEHGLPEVRSSLDGETTWITPPGAVLTNLAAVLVALLAVFLS